MGELPLLSLFCGPGGLDLGFEQSGFRSLLALDIDPVAIDTFNWNRRHTFPPPGRVQDLAAADPELILARWKDAAAGLRPVGIIGGPPCQAFSVSNVHKLEDDPRARLPYSYAGILAAFNRRYGLDFFVFENVAGLANTRHSASLEAFMYEFAGAGFTVTSFFLDSASFGVPQHRNRMFIVGLNRERFNVSDFTAPSEQPRRITVRETIGHLPEPAYFSRGLRRDDIPYHVNHWCLNPRSPKFHNGALRPGEMIGRSFRTLQWDEPSWTVAYGHREMHVHPNGKRRVSIYEAMLLQGFPAHYELRGNLTDQIRQVSDAVPPPLAKALAGDIGELIYSASAKAADAHERESGHPAQLGLFGVQTAAPRSTSA
ncbi:MAG: DNA cytosine methyltransferase [Dehalococcoidia bacterium]|nr:DNA cytosine methyltransferase [Dehalococcoidia bacterium]